MTHPITKILAPVTRKYPDMTLRQLSLLAHLHGARPRDRQVRHLAQSLGVGKPIISRAADRLEQDKLAVRKGDGDDLRLVMLEITKAGTALLSACIKAVRLEPDEAAQPPSPPRRKASPVKAEQAAL